MWEIKKGIRRLLVVVFPVAQLLEHRYKVTFDKSLCQNVNVNHQCIRMYCKVGTKSDKSTNVYIKNKMNAITRVSAIGYLILIGQSAKTDNATLLQYILPLFPLFYYKLYFSFK